MECMCMCVESNISGNEVIHLEFVNSFWPVLIRWNYDEMLSPPDTKRQNQNQDEVEHVREIKGATKHSQTIQLEKELEMPKTFEHFEWEKSSGERTPTYDSWANLFIWLPILECNNDINRTSEWNCEKAYLNEQRSESFIFSHSLPLSIQIYKPQNLLCDLKTINWMRMTFNKLNNTQNSFPTWFQCVYFFVCAWAWIKISSHCPSGIVIAGCHRCWLFAHCLLGCPFSCVFVTFFFHSLFFRLFLF